MTRLPIRLLACGTIAFAIVGAQCADPPATGRDLVLDVAGDAIRLRVVMTIDGKPLIFPPDSSSNDSATVDETPSDSAATAGRSPFEIVVQPQPLVDRLELYAALDADSDGYVTQSELGDSERLFAIYDSDGDGTLSLSELAPTEPLQPMPVRTGADFPAGRFPFHWESPSGTPDAVVEINLIERAFGRPKMIVNEPGAGDTDRPPAESGPSLSIAAETRSVSIEAASLALDLDATPSRVSSEDVKRFYMLQLIQRDADKNGYLDESEFLGLGLPGLDFKAADANGDGMLFRDEFRKELDSRIANEGNRVRIEATYERNSLFSKLDSDGDRRLSRRELRKAGAVLSSIDGDGDGRIGLAEFGGRYRLAFRIPNLLDAASPQMAAAVEAMPAGPSSRSAEGPAWFAAMDRNGDGDLARREFLGTRDQFERLDTDGDELISPQEGHGAVAGDASPETIDSTRNTTAGND